MESIKGERLHDLVKRIYYYHKEIGLVDLRELYPDEDFPSNIEIVRVQDSIYSVEKNIRFIDDDRNIDGLIVLMKDQDINELDIFEIIDDLTDVIPLEYEQNTDFTKASFMLEQKPEFDKP